MLVSIIVATFNCAHYIEATLDSVYRQTYNDIELIVTDDCSIDDSVAVARRWIEKHRERFVRTAQTQTMQNSGVTANYNAGLCEVRGEWVKCLDGDDILPDDAIETYVKHCSTNTMIPVWYAHEQPFDDQGAKGPVNRTHLPHGKARKQMIYLLNHRLLGICTATNFIHRATFAAKGGFDSRYPMYQDGSPFLQTLAEGKSVGVIDKVTLLKRENPDSLMHTANPVMVANIRDCHNNYCKYYLHYFMPLHYYNAWLTYWIATHDTTRWHFKTLGYLLRSIDLVNLYRKLFGQNN
ncbi:MAG: glycosyltransferase [Bacteroidales bacterium]|nr:glycosyltransferase [Bacteroidales bacterium]